MSNPLGRKPTYFWSQLLEPFSTIAKNSRRSTSPVLIDRGSLIFLLLSSVLDRRGGQPRLLDDSMSRPFYWVVQGDGDNGGQASGRPRNQQDRRQSISDAHRGPNNNNNNQNQNNPHHHHWRHFNGYGRRNNNNQNKIGKHPHHHHRSDNCSNWRSATQETTADREDRGGVKEGVLLHQFNRAGSWSDSQEFGGFRQAWEELLPDGVILKIGSFLDKSTRDSMKKAGRRFSAILSHDEIAGARRRRRQQRAPGQMGLEELPTEVLTHLCSFLGEPDLAALMRVCWRLKAVVSSDYVWSAKANECLVTNSKCPKFSSRTAPAPLETALERVRVSRNWTKGAYRESRLTVHDTRYMPRVQLERLNLWVSWGNKIWSHPRRADGTVDRKTNRVLKSHTVDVSQFVVKDGYLISGGRDGTLVGWNSGDGEFLFAKRHCHGSEVSAVDVVRASGVIVTGSRDKTVKIWALDPPHHGSSLNVDGKECPQARFTRFPSCLTTMDIGDRIWSLAVDPQGDKVAVGTAGLMGIPCLRVVDLKEGAAGSSGRLRCQELGQNLQNGAGMLDILWLCSNTFLSCGYDTCARLWDIRTETYVRSWEEPFDAAVYCMATDGNMSLVCGTARHGLVRLWDMRQTNPVQMFYTKHAFYGRSSPVYSVAFDQKHLYVALDQCLNLLSFASDTDSSWRPI